MSRHPRRLPAPPTLLLLAACAGALPASAPCQDGVQRVEVVGTSPLPGLDLPREQVPGPVQTARNAELERSHAGDLAEFMRRRLGSVHVNDVQGNGFQPDLNYRGFTASPLLGTAQGLSVYLDGVRLNQPFGDVVSWDLIPKAAIASITLMPGSNPLFGLNTLGGALAVQTKDGLGHPGQAVALEAGSHGRAALSFESGGQAQHWHWFVTGLRHRDDGWRTDSPSRVAQLFGKLGHRTSERSLTLTAALADNRLHGNGLQEDRLLAQDRSSVYTRPDVTTNRAQLLSLALTQQLAPGLVLSGNAHLRRVNSHTLNGDINEDALDQAVYQPGAAERAALAQAGYSGFPVAGENAQNTPFPQWRCIAQALLRDEPAEKCNGLINTTRTRQSQQGLSLQLAGQAAPLGLAGRFVAGVALERSRVHFVQGSELGYLNADRSVTGVGAFGDGVSGGVVDDEPYDTRVDLASRTRTGSVYGSAQLALARALQLTLSGRYNRSSVSSRDAITPGGGTGSLDGDHVFARFNPALGLTVQAGGGVSAWLGLNQGSRAPSAVELGCADPESPCKLPNAMAGDPPLRQVVTTTAEAGVRGGGAGHSWSLGLFRADNRDDILFVADNAAGYGYFRNFGRTRRQGLEAGFSTRVAGVQLGAQYTWIDARFRSAERLGGAGNSRNDQALAGRPGVDGTLAVAPGDRLPLVPRQLLKLTAQGALGAGLSWSGDVSAVGGSFARGNENNAHQPDGTYYLGSGRSGGYAVANLGLDWQPASGLGLFVQVNNLFDRRYATAAQLGVTGFDAQGRFVARPFPANAEGQRPLLGSTFHAPGAPRSVVAGLRWSFGS